MAKKPSPWYWTARNAWYVTIGGKRHALGSHPVHAPRPKLSPKTGKWNSPPTIDAAFQNLLRGEAVTAPTAGESVVAVLDDFVTWCHEHKAPITARRYEEFCQDFVRFTPEQGLKIGLLSTTCLSSKHVTQWLATHRWGPTNKRNAITALQRGFNWAVKNRGLPRNPIAGMEKPTAQVRTTLVQPHEFDKLLTAIPDEGFRNLLILSYDSGARPFEIKALEKRHLRLDQKRAILPKDEAKGRRHLRTIYFPTDRCISILQKLGMCYPNGSLLRNQRGNPWTAQAVKCRLEDLDHVLGRRVRHYDFRHGFITRKLVAGVDSHIVAKLVGHRDTKMLDSVYSHVADDYEFMLREARKDV